MKETLCRLTEEWYGIKADPDDINKLEEHLLADGMHNKNLEHVFSSGEAAEFLTVNETYFFREPVHFALLLELLSSCNKAAIRICSAATSAGCEAYSIAMLMDAYNKNAEKPVSYTIDAFDINPNTIKKADHGIYNTRSLREDGSCFSHISDLYIKKNEGGIQIDHGLKNNINFFVHNLMDELYPEFYDFIFFRNAFIYILPDYRERVLSNLASSLKESGYLIMGVSETSGVKHWNLVQKMGRLHSQKEDVFYFQKNSFQKPAKPEYNKYALAEQSAG